LFQIGPEENMVLGLRCKDMQIVGSEPVFIVKELNRKSASLKKILSRIPDEITDRKTFLETIKVADTVHSSGLALLATSLITADSIFMFCLLQRIE
jgi:hypothetical protein